MPLNTEEQRYHVLDGLRGVAAIAVMCGHFSQQKISILGHPVVPFTQSSLAVDLFFILSGFVLCHAYGSRLAMGLSFPGLMLRRLVRLYPMFLIGLAFGAAGLLAIVASGRADVGARDALASLWSNLFFLPYLARDQVRDATGGLISSPIFPANPPAWSLFFEMVASAGLFWLIRLRGRTLAMLAAIGWTGFVIAGFWVGLDGHKTGFNPSIGWSLDSFFGGFFRVTYGFALGMLIHRWRAPIAQALCSRLPRWLLNPWVIYAIALAALVNPFAARGVLTAPTLLVVMPMLVALGTMCRPAGAGVTTVSLLLGSLSYPLYCLHYPIGRLLGLAWPELAAHNAAFTGIAAAVSIAAAYLAAKLIDEPAQRAIARLRAARTAHISG
ncbi:peptidoglycan/LPS O-acetylase OafA/YrhL [Rhizobium sp. SG_E_25_P2]|uniref:acyltransferase family protein n=1 Tax=Rhizobium sp. SG_E_25_P2 TaxID=2879942 RepID=UPI0024731B62|nr:acyltransferase [Rhizobium sp. SG_E_25_P2]MDH6269517.1 peptidoglycan/LPS O-acetylase OafA/YrhL [Rhizobium sp. SG_E_25_P2]